MVETSSNEPNEKQESSSSKPSGSIFSQDISKLGPSLFMALFLILLALFTFPDPIGFLMIAFGLVFILTIARGGEVHWTRRFGFIIRWGFVLLCIAGVWAWNAYEEYRESLVVPTEEDYKGIRSISPYFETTSLDESPELTLPFSDIPRIDGAIALGPLYQSFVDYVFISDSLTRRREKVSTTPEAYNALIAGKVDMVFCAPPSDDEKRRAAEAGLELVITPIGREAFVFIVNEKNTIPSLTIAQIKDIYAGRVTRWKQVGGTGGAIIPFQRDPNSGSQSRMERFMRGDTLVPPRMEWRVVSMGGLVERVARHRNYRESIGYSFLFYISNMVDKHGLRLLPVEGIAPTTESIRDGSYPLTETICVVTTGTDHPSVQPFIEWILSPQGQRMVEKVGYVPIESTVSE